MLDQGERLAIGPRLERLPMSWAIGRIVFLAGLAWFVESFDIGAIGVILPVLHKVLGLSTGQTGTLAVASTIGIVLGMIPAGRLADRLGRRRLLIAGVAVYSVLTLAAALSPTFNVLLLFRFLSGFGMGAVFPLPYTMASELLPSHKRTWISGVLDACLSMGYFIAPLLGLLIIPNFPSVIAWRIFLGLGAVPVIYAVVVWKWMPESPRWLMARGRSDEALAVVGYLEQETVRYTGAALPEPAATPTAAAVSEPGATPWSRRYWRRTLVGIAAATGTFFMFYVVMTYMPTIFSDKGFSYATSFGFAAIITGCAIPGKLLNGWLAERWGRKPAVAVFLGLAVIGAMMFGVATSATSFLLYGIAMSLFGTGAFPAVKMYYAEQYPTDMRGLGSSTVEATARFLGGVVGPSVMPWAWQRFGLSASFTVIAAVAAVAVVVLLYWGVESRGLSLEAIQARYRSPNRVPVAFPFHQ